MSSRVLVTNLSEFNFKASSILFSEVEIPLEKFWESKMTESIVSIGESKTLGKLICPNDFPNSANFIVSIILSIENLSDTQSKDTFLVLKSRIKSSKSSENVYAYASCFPEKLTFTRPQWHKGTSKNYFITNFFDKILQISYKISWNDNITFVIEQIYEIPVFCKFHQPESGVVVDDFYENQWKSNTLGNSKYSHNPISVHTDRPPYSTINGRPILSKTHLMPPTPLWVWIDDWHLDTFPNNEDGWIYMEDWKAATLKPENSTKFRLRRWIRTRILKKDLVEENSKMMEFISNHFLCTVNKLDKFMSPFLKALKRDVFLLPENFDFKSIAAIPSPRLRRQIKVINCNSDSTKTNL